MRGRRGTPLDAQGGQPDSCDLEVNRQRWRNQSTAIDSAQVRRLRGWHSVGPILIAASRAQPREEGGPGSGLWIRRGAEGIGSRLPVTCLAMTAPSTDQVLGVLSLIQDP